MFQVFVEASHISPSIPTPSGFCPPTTGYLRILLFLERQQINELATTLECTDTGRIVTKVDGGVNGDWYADS